MSWPVLFSCSTHRCLDQCLKQCLARGGASYMPLGGTFSEQRCPGSGEVTRGAVWVGWTTVVPKMIPERREKGNFPQIRFLSELSISLHQPVPCPHMLCSVQLDLSRSGEMSVHPEAERSQSVNVGVSAVHRTVVQGQGQRQPFWKAEGKQKV